MMALGANQKSPMSFWVEMPGVLVATFNAWFLIHGLLGSTKNMLMWVKFHLHK
jgi:hypothetical protein